MNALTQVEIVFFHPRRVPLFGLGGEEDALEEAVGDDLDVLEADLAVVLGQLEVHLVLGHVGLGAVVGVGVPLVAPGVEQAVALGDHGVAEVGNLESGKKRGLDDEMMTLTIE